MSTTWYVVFNEEFDENFGMDLDDESEQHSTSVWHYPFILIEFQPNIVMIV